MPSASPAAVLLQGLTAHMLSETVYPIMPGDTVLIHAAASGVGYYLVQLAKQRGARVIGTTSAAEKAQAVIEAGASHVLLISNAGWEDTAHQLTNHTGVHVVYDGVGQATFNQGLRLLRPQGHIVVYGLASGPVAPFDINRLSGITGSEERGSLSLTWANLSDYVARSEDLRWRAAEVFGWATEGRLRLCIDDSLALSEASEAHRRIEARTVQGKLLLRP